MIFKKKPGRYADRAGELRLLSRFAWFPRTMSNGDVVWLETYYVVDELFEYIGWTNKVTFYGKASLLQADGGYPLWNYWDKKVRETNSRIKWL